MKYECCKLAQKISFMHAIDQFQDFFITYLKSRITKEPENLYEPSPTY
jgi:geranylgeranyl diphosphate synthase type II